MVGMHNRLPVADSSLLRAWGRSELNPLTTEVARRRSQGRPFLDLVGASPQECDLAFPPEELLRVTEEATRKSLVYRPDPRGQLSAREAIAAYYERRGAPARPDRLILTPGTSMAYFYALRLLCEAGDEILVPRPGYPLFDDLCRVSGVRQRYYHYVRRPGHEGARWRPDLEDIEFQCTPRTRAIAVVSPHNPLGTVFTESDLEALARICRARGLALLFDEVFCEFRGESAGPFPRPRGEDFPLAVLLNGFSKMLSLPGSKVAWMKVDGEEEAVQRLLAGLEYASDLFLPVSEVAQATVPGLLEVGEREVFGHLAREYSRRRALVEGMLGDWLEPADGGIYLCGSLDAHDARLGRGRRRLDGPGRHADDDVFALRVLDELDVLVHPGHFYDLPGHFVMTCVARPEDLAEGSGRLASWLRTAVDSPDSPT